MSSSKTTFALYWYLAIEGRLGLLASSCMWPFPIKVVSINQFETIIINITSSELLRLNMTQIGLLVLGPLSITVMGRLYLGLYVESTDMNSIPRKQLA